MLDLGELERFIVESKRATYIGDGIKADPSRMGAHDLTFECGVWSYRDSYFGGADFLGQEVVWREGEPRWAMNYYGYILRPDLFDAAMAGRTVKAALSAMYAEGRFLGGFAWEGPDGRYLDTSEGDVAHFRGREIILRGDIDVYALEYFGGLIRP